MSSESTHPGDGEPPEAERSPLSRRRFLSAGSGVAAGVLAAGLVSRPAAAAAASHRATAAPVDLSGAHWVWFPEGSPQVSAPAGFRYFRRTFTAAAGGVGDAQLVVTGDDTVDVWLNGQHLAASARVADSWKNALYVDLRPALAAGSNTVAIAVSNTGGPAGLLGHLHITTSGSTTDLLTDGSWRTAQTVPAGWEQPSFDDSGWSAAADLGAYGVSPWYTGVATPDLTAASPLAASGLTVEHQASPLGVDAAQPRFGWTLDSSAPQQHQAAYQVQVSSTAAGAGDVWDSGQVSSAQQVDLAYGGPALGSLTRYYWRVRVWDTQGRAGAWSDLGWFETGLLGPATEWQGAFVGQAAPPNFAGASWIWYPEGNPASSAPAATRWFRRTLTLATAPATAVLAVTGDDTADVWVNGVLVSSSPRVANSWQTAALVDLAGHLTAGANVIAVACTNTSVSPAGLLAKLLLPGGQVVNSDTAWKASQSGPTGWNTVGFDDSAWPAAISVAVAGSGPWGVQVHVVTPAPLLRKGFTVSKPVASARLLTTALGLHETRLNGAKVGADVLAPGWTDYGKRLQYKVFDVTGQIRQGANALAAWLGNGWYSGSIGFAGSQKYGTQPWYSAQLQLTFTDGTTSTVATDSSWKTATGAIRADDLYNGETYDARLDVPGWDGAGFDDSAWASVTVAQVSRPTLVSQVDGGVTVQAEFPPVAITQPQAGVWILDLGQNFAGWNRLSLTGPAGTVVTMRHGEVLNPDGTLYTANLRTAQATDRFVLAGTGSAETYEPRFTVHGYRYVELTGLPSGFTPTTGTVTGRAAWTTAAQLGTFTTSNTLVGQIQHNITWGQRSNMLSIPTDCPQRDERLGWTGDIAAFNATSTFNLDTHRFLAKFVDDLVDDQLSSGAFTDVAPAVISGSGTAGWGDAGVIIPYTLWQRFGDLRVVDRHFPALAAWVDYLHSTAGSNLIRNQTTFGDWLNVNDDTPHDLICTAYFAWAARLVSRMAAATGRTAQAAWYGQLADQVAAAFASQYVGSDGSVGSNTQTGYVLALSFGLVPAALVQRAADKLAAKVAASNGHLTVGFLGVENLLPVLADNGHADVAYQILLQTSYPGWGYMVGRGATTIWERWDGIRTDGSFEDPGMNSFNHYGLGSVGDFLYRHVAGLRPAAPGYQELLIAPQPGGGLTSAAASYRTPCGTAGSNWSVAGGQVTLAVTVPANVTATVVVPTSQPGSVSAPAQAVPTAPGTYDLPAGTYTFTAPV
ncbi:family 78 glycoside hydrolase catalytic domain [Streptacidiphilus anmyonensis]|uniref:family 78 glycoside hydrolase catalytic domain n=1 Tax=Streptacidiphilus anmyonensis TaxID=405782 RepID=UPI000694AE8D|nr:family 78 glycoside hydrolase catalytic domain [Streptacidiphilus anmyonensis]